MISFKILGGAELMTGRRNHKHGRAQISRAERGGGGMGKSYASRTTSEGMVCWWVVKGWSGGRCGEESKGGVKTDTRFHVEAGDSQNFNLCDYPYGAAWFGCPRGGYNT